MSCCCRITTEVFMANIFAVLGKTRPLTFNELQAYVEHVRNVFYTYVPTDFC